MIIIRKIFRKSPDRIANILLTYSFTVFSAFKNFKMMHIAIKNQKILNKL